MCHSLLTTHLYSNPGLPTLGSPHLVSCSESLGKKGGPQFFLIRSLRNTCARRTQEKSPPKTTSQPPTMEKQQSQLHRAPQSFICLGNLSLENIFSCLTLIDTAMICIHSHKVSEKPVKEEQPGFLRHFEYQKST